jgi:hypothetical protein
MRAADDFEAIGKAARRVAALRYLAATDPRRVAVITAAEERGIREGMVIPREIFLAAGYTEAELDEMRRQADSFRDSLRREER